MSSLVETFEPRELSGEQLTAYMIGFSMGKTYWAREHGLLSLEGIWRAALVLYQQR